MIDETSLLQMMTTIATHAGERLLAVYSPDARPANMQEMLDAARRNERVSSDGTRDALR